jgi:diguanylate cyclase (GGDEF)-like protein/PAS domain S-box-containing protein
VTLLTANSSTHARAALAAADLHGDLAELANNNFDLANPALLSPAAVRAKAVTRAEVASELAALRANQFRPSKMVALTRAVNAGLAAYDSMVRLSTEVPPGSPSDLSTSTFLELTTIAQSNDALIDIATAAAQVAVTQERADAEQASRLSGIAMASLAAVVVGCAVAVTLWDARRRREIANERTEQRSRMRFEAIVEHGFDLTLLTDPVGGGFEYVSPSAGRLLGYPAGTLDGPLLAGRIHAEDALVPRRLVAEAHAQGGGGPEDLRLQHADGSWRTLSIRIDDLTAVDAVKAMLWSAADVTDRRRLEAELERQAFEDSLTGLPNRALFQDRLKHAVARGGREGSSVAILLADLDRFKTLNDSLGHDAGDRVLTAVAQRLAGCLRPSDTVARVGGDEFTVLVEDLADASVAQEVANRIQEALRQPFTVAGTDIRIGASIGIAVSVPGRESADELLRNADMAMYSAKTGANGRWAMFAPVMFAQADRDLHLTAELDGALARSELEVYYQPTYRLDTGALEGAEALLRWNHPTRGLVPPLQFIPSAEQTGQIVAIGRWVLEQACRQAAGWHEAHPDAAPLTIGVNLSGRQLADEDLVEDVRRALDSSGIAPESVVLEITESVLMHDVESVTARLHELKALGVRLAIDDFGTGYSSLAYLSQFPVDMLKIDRSFVVGASTGAPGGEALVRAIVDMGASLKLSTIAEGIEEQGQADSLLALGCMYGQGYLFARPMPAADFACLVETPSPAGAPAV